MNEMNKKTNLKSDAKSKVIKFSDEALNG